MVPRHSDQSHVGKRVGRWTEGWVKVKCIRDLFAMAAGNLHKQELSRQRCVNHNLVSLLRHAFVGRKRGCKTCWDFATWTKAGLDGELARTPC